MTLLPLGVSAVGNRPGSSGEGLLGPEHILAPTVRIRRARTQWQYGLCLGDDSWIVMKRYRVQVCRVPCECGYGTEGVENSAPSGCSDLVA